MYLDPSQLHKQAVKLKSCKIKRWSGAGVDGGGCVYDVVSGDECYGSVKWLIFGCKRVLVTDGQTDRHWYF